MNLTKTIFTLGLATSAAFAAKYEAESATVAGGATASGSIVELYDGSLTFSNISVDAAGKYNITFNCASPYGAKQNSVLVNGTEAGTIITENDATFKDITIRANLNAGSNTIAVKATWGWIKIDYIEITPFAAETDFVETSFTLSSTPVTANATESAQKLYAFLAENFGKNVISGVMTGDMDSYQTSAAATEHPDMKDVFTRSGKYTAIVGIDLMNAFGKSVDNTNPNDWYVQYTKKGIAVAKSMWKLGGIPAITWHWRDPSKTNNAFYATQDAAKDQDPPEWTTFRAKDAMKSGTTEWDTESDAYKNIIAGLDVIAPYLLELQTEGVAAIFRPLHEAGGAWFWWSEGTTGAEYAALYRLVYDYLVKEKGIKNLIWVFNPERSLDNTWDPGSEYYDVIAVDIYNGDNDNSSNGTVFESFKEKWGKNKIFALSENGPIPDITEMQTDHSLWSWWMPWYGTWGGKWIGQTSNDVWKSNMESARVITLDEMPGWDKASTTPDFDKPVPSSPSTSSESSSSGTSVSSSATAGVSSSSNAGISSNSEATTAIASKFQGRLSVAQLGKTLSIAGTNNAKVHVFDMQGRPILVKNAVSGQISLESLKNGNYIVKIQDEKASLIKKISIR